MGAIGDVIQTLGGPGLVPREVRRGAARRIAGRGCPTPRFRRSRRALRSRARPSRPSWASRRARSPAARRSAVSRRRSRTGSSASAASPRWREDVLGTRAKASAWLHTDNRSLGGATPLSRLDTDLGAEEVESVLLRLSHGVVG